MKNLKSLLLILCFALAAIGAKAATISGSLYQKDFKITYQSVDAFNNSITLSARLYVPYKVVGFWLNPKPEEIKLVVMNCHPTISHSNGAPTGDDPQLEAIKYMTSENALVICPDYIGFGESKNVLHPYMCTTLTARNIMDCYKAAITYTKNTLKASFNNNYYTINIGYSQGGTNALAFHKYLETEATQAEKDQVKLRGSLCGAGVYDQQMAFDEYEKKGEVSYPAYLPYAIQGLYEEYKNTTMRNSELKDFFTDRFWNSEFFALLNEKETNIDDLNTWLINNNYKQFYDIISEEYKVRSSVVYRTLAKTFAQCNLIDGSWKPTLPIKFYHYQNDEVVPPVETDAAMAAFAGCNVQKLTQDDYNISNNGAWDIAFSLGGYSRDLNHRNCGVYFYLMFLSTNLRPNGSDVSRAVSLVDIEGTKIQNVDIDVAATAGKYDRINIVLPQEKIVVGKPIYVQFPAKVDGYTFGCNAERYHLTLDADGKVTDIEPMDDFDDFEAGETYLVVPEVAVASPVYSYTAGVRTPCLGAPCMIDNVKYSIGGLARLIDKLNAGSNIYKLEHVGKMQNGILEK